MPVSPPSYPRQTWEDDNPSFPLSAARMRHMENGLSEIEAFTIAVEEALEAALAQRPKRFKTTIGDGASSSFIITHNLGVLRPAVVAIWDLSLATPAQVSALVQQGADTNHLVVSAAAWEETPPAVNSLEIVVLA